MPFICVDCSDFCDTNVCPKDSCNNGRHGVQEIDEATYERFVQNKKRDKAFKEVNGVYDHIVKNLVGVYDHKTTKLVRGEGYDLLEDFEADLIRYRDNLLSVEGYADQKKTKLWDFTYFADWLSGHFTLNHYQIYLGNEFEKAVYAALLKQYKNCVFQPRFQNKKRADIAINAELNGSLFVRSEILIDCKIGHNAIIKGLQRGIDYYKEYCQELWFVSLEHINHSSFNVDFKHIKIFHWTEIISDEHSDYLKSLQQKVDNVAVSHFEHLIQIESGKTKEFIEVLYQTRKQIQMKLND